ncbi:hypothetical protein AAC387_Pa05g3221 [Persea americana]
MCSTTSATAATPARTETPSASRLKMRGAIETRLPPPMGPPIPPPVNMGPVLPLPPTKDAGGAAKAEAPPRTPNATRERGRHTAIAAYRCGHRWRREHQITDIQRKPRHTTPIQEVIKLIAHVCDYSLLERGSVSDESGVMLHEEKSIRSSAMDPDDIDAPLRVVAVRMEEGLINKISLFVTVNCVKPVGDKMMKSQFHVVSLWQTDGPTSGQQKEKSLYLVCTLILGSRFPCLTWRYYQKTT